MTAKAALLIGAALLAESSALAQISAPASASEGQSSDGAGAAAPALQDIVVTAQRREERLQDVPIAVSAITGETLGNRGVTDVVALSRAIPGLVATQPTPAPLIFLRGVGSNAANPNDEASVATYVDGVYMASPFANVMEFNNVERVEVLKGPQGTLFGRNATGGVIQIITREPGRDPTAELKLGYGSYETINGSLYASTPLAQDAAIDLAVQFKDQNKGFGRNVTLDREVHEGSSFGIRSKLVFEPGDTTKIRLAGDYGRNRNSFADFRLPPGVLGVNGVPTAQGQDTSTNIFNSVEAKQWGVSLRVDQEIGSLDFTSISAYRKSYGSYTFDPDATALNVLDGYLGQRQHNVSQEFQLANSSPGLQWLVGLFYYNNYAAYVNTRLAGLAFAPLTSIDPEGAQRTKSLAAYGQATATIVPELDLTLGLRYTHERQTFDGAINAIGFVAPKLKQGYDRLTWRSALDYKFSEQVHAYVSYNRGIKSGGFDLLSPGVPGYAPEVLDSYEAGLKSELLDRRLRANFAVFQYDYKDIQVQSIVVGTVVTTNAASARIRGFEAELQAVPITNLTITGSLQILHGRYRDFPNAISYPSSPFGTGPTVIDASGKDTVRSPDYTWNVGASYRIPTSIGEFQLSGDLSYNDGFYFAPDNNFRQRSYTVANATLGWESPNGGFGLTAWVRNLTDASYLAHGVPGSFGDLSISAPPRTYGATASVKF